jgi:hypothetical protein
MFDVVAIAKMLKLGSGWLYQERQCELSDLHIQLASGSKLESGKSKFSEILAAYAV